MSGGGEGSKLSQNVMEDKNVQWLAEGNMPVYCTASRTQVETFHRSPGLISLIHLVKSRHKGEAEPGR